MATLLKTAGACFMLLMLLVGTKFLLEDRLGPTDSGLRAALDQPGIDILLIGSSHAKQGYDPKLLEQITGKRVFVVAYDGLDPVSMLPVAAALLARPSTRPRLVIVEANGLRLAQAPDVEDWRLFFESPPAVKLALLRTYLQNHKGLEAYLDLFTLAANRGNDLILTWPLVHRTLDALSYHGGYVNKTMAGLTPQAFAALSLPIDGDRPNPQQLAALQEIIGLAKDDHVELWLADTPMAAPIARQPRMASLAGAYQALAEQQGVPYFRGVEGFPTDDPALFHDPSHLSTSGRELYTRLFARKLLDAGGGR